MVKAEILQVFPYPCQMQPGLFVFSCISKSVTWYGELIAYCKLPNDTQHYSGQPRLFEIAMASLVVKPEVMELSICVAVLEPRPKSNYNFKQTGLPRIVLVSSGNLWYAISSPYQVTLFEDIGVPEPVWNRTDKWAWGSKDGVLHETPR
jgi:hypothetical protein